MNGIMIEYKRSHSACCVPGIIVALGEYDAHIPIAPGIPTSQCCIIVPFDVLKCASSIVHSVRHEKFDTLKVVFLNGDSTLMHRAQAP